MTELVFTHDPERRRYEAWLDEERVSLVTYRDDGQRVIINHTETPPVHQGHGYAGEVTRYALDDLRRQGRKIIPSCPYTAAWIRDHPDYADMLA